MALDEYVTSGFVSNGTLTVRNRRGFDRAVSQMREGEVTVTITRRRATRSQLQNAWYWGQIVALISEHTGFTPDETHEVLKAKFLPKKLAMVDGNGEIQGEFVIGGSTTRLNKLEFGEYCESIRRWAAEDLSLVIPDPDPDWREKAKAA